MAKMLTSPPVTFAAATLAVLIGSGASFSVREGAAADAAASIERGRYIVAISGCNDCQTPGFGKSGGKVPEVQWLIGDRLGFRGPWGTTYPPNLSTAVGN